MYGVHVSLVLMTRVYTNTRAQALEKLQKKKSASESKLKAALQENSGLAAEKAVHDRVVRTLNLKVNGYEKESNKLKETSRRTYAIIVCACALLREYECECECVVCECECIYGCVCVCVCVCVCAL
jgi:hypothetical protein